jgi:hypothetical protein
MTGEYKIYDSYVIIQFTEELFKNSGVRILERIGDIILKGDIIGFGGSNYYIKEE